MAIWRSVELWRSNNFKQNKQNQLATKFDTNIVPFRNKDETEFLKSFPDQFPEPFEWQTINEEKKA